MFRINTLFFKYFVHKNLLNYPIVKNGAFWTVNRTAVIPHQIFYEVAPMTSSKLLQQTQES